jgi:DNA invertase Pin-like site-specific DNA recombinase
MPSPAMQLGSNRRLSAPRRLIDTRRHRRGRSRAQKRGQQMGRPPKLTPAQQAEARRRPAEGATLAELAGRYGVGKSTISRL